MEDQPTGDGPRSRAAVYVGVAAFVVAGVADLLLRDWLSGAFFLAGAAFFLFGRRIERLPRPTRYLLVALYAALAVAMFVGPIIKYRSRG